MYRMLRYQLSGKLQSILPKSLAIPKAQEPTRFFGIRSKFPRSRISSGLLEDIRFAPSTKPDDSTPFHERLYSLADKTDDPLGTNQTIPIVTVINRRVASRAAKNKRLGANKSLRACFEHQVDANVRSGTAVGNISSNKPRLDTNGRKYKCSEYYHPTFVSPHSPFA
jgi:hypothetical protein